MTGAALAIGLSGKFGAAPMLIAYALLMPWSNLHSSPIVSAAIWAFVPVPVLLLFPDSMNNQTALALSIILPIASTRLYYVVPHGIFLVLGNRYMKYQWHPIAWDEQCTARLPGLDIILLRYFQNAPELAEQEIERIISEYPSQQYSAKRARCLVVSYKALRLSSLCELSTLIDQLPCDDARFPRLREFANACHRICAEYDRLLKMPYNMPVYRVVQAERVHDAVVSFCNDIAGSTESLVSGFREAGRHWLALAEDQVDYARQAADREPFPQVFRAGDPIQGEKAEAFIPRQQVIAELVGLVLATNGCPGILLYARRRMGKSTCLQNLMGFIPTSIDIAFISLLDPTKCSSMSLFCEQVALAITEALADKHLEAVPATSAVKSLSEFSQLLDAANSELGKAGRRLLIALDEFEYLDVKFAKLDDTERSLITDDLLRLFRSSIQMHRNLIWLFSGSHRITDLKNAEWPSYLISVRTIELDRFTLEETSQLLTDPLAYSQLFKGAADRPKFSPEFWGTNGLQRIHETADGWPHLVVLLAETCVNLVNQQNVALVTDELFEGVRRKAILSGDNVMIQLLMKESEISGEWEYLLGFRDQDVLPEPENPAIRKSLLRRSLVTIHDNQVRLRVPLMHQWIRERSELLD